MVIPSASQDTPSRFRQFLHAAIQPRMLALLVVFLVIAAVCASLGRWQLDRAFEKAQLSEQQEQYERETQGPEPIGQVLAPQEKFAGELVGRSVRVTGVLEAQHFYVSGRAVNDQPGVLVLAGLRVTDTGSADGDDVSSQQQAVLPLIVGWASDVAEGETVALPDSEVTLDVYLQGPEQVEDEPDASGVVSSIAPAQLVNYWGGPIYSAYAVAVDPEDLGADELVALPRPQIDGSGSGLDIRNLFYALEWWVFGGFAVALWIRMVLDAKPGKRLNPFEVAGIGQV